MTLWVSRDGQKVTIHGNTGLDVKVEESRVTSFAVSEHYGHLRHFWGQLGVVLQEAEQDAADQVAAVAAQEGM
jgi:hypothetical protein